ncbi:hypothetical protein [Methanogenium cariaci]|nr:hypothetical protein [Methanogenium cariaci]
MWFVRILIPGGDEELKFCYVLPVMDEYFVGSGGVYAGKVV